jgi:uncharacterized membrane protein
MRLIFKPLLLLERLRSTYWFVPLMVTAGCAGLAFGLVAVDRRLSPGSSLGWMYEGGAEGARAVLSAVAGSTMTVVGVTFSVIVVALTVASQHFGPRLLNNFMLDNVSQLVLGTFTGTFVYCLVVLRTVQGDGGDLYDRFIPHVAVTGGLALALGSVLVLIYYVHHVAKSMQVSEITQSVARELERAIDRMYPARFGAEAAGDNPSRPPVPAAGWPVASSASGYVQDVDATAVLALASEHDTTIWIVGDPGAFVIEDQPLAVVSPAPADPAALERRLRDAFVLGNDRSSHQDVGFAVQQLVEVALRALSPGTNETFTAVICIDRLGSGLARVAGRHVPGGVRLDEHGKVRVIATPTTFVTLLDASFGVLAMHMDRDAIIASRLLDALHRLVSAARRPEDRLAIGRVADRVLQVAEQRLEHQEDRASVQRLHQVVQNSLALRADPARPNPV